MAALDVAREAFVHTRTSIRLKAPNKVSEDKADRNEKYAQRHNESDEALRKLRKWSSERQLAEKSLTLKKFVEKIISFGAGGCAEYALVAIYYIRSKDMWPKEQSGVVSLVNGDHAFIQVGLTKPLSGIYPVDFAEWHGAAICDPWANICCPADQYPQQWADKMEKWDDRGVRVSGVKAYSIKEDVRTLVKEVHSSYGTI